MGDLTFSQIMEFYPAHNRSVYEDLKKDFQRGGLIPFVGAGLSVFCGYMVWPKVLEKLAGFIYDESIRKNVEAMIRKGELLQAAQEIQENYPRMLKELQKIIDHDKIKNCAPAKLYASAAYALPYLFGDGLVMTTNFDRVLEEVYDKCHVKFGKIVSPYEPDLLTQIRQGDSHCLFKLHGDIGPEIYDINKLVFTQAQYDEAYAADGPLMRELPQWFQSKRLLFLGCSLMKDKTMEALQQVTLKNPGLDHYAVLECSPGEIGCRCRELSELGISPIVYPPGRHEAVRVVLERLLEEVNHSAYEELKRYAEQSVPRSRAEQRFMFDSGYIKFTGREEELEQLHQFCEDSRIISWWAVTGPGGLGKSRLVYEFTERQREKGWKVYWLKQNDYDGLADWPLPADPCIVVADDVQAYLQVIGKWIISVSARQRSEKLRILLLEREGKNLESAKWAEMMQDDAPYDDTIPTACYNTDFLQLSKLPEEELKTIMVDFAAASEKVLAKSGQADRLIETLRKIDGGFQRPIYALAIVDAWCNEKDPTRWDKGQVLEELTKREMRFYYERLQNLSPGKISKELRSEFENLLARSCVERVLPLNSITNKEYPKLHNRADKLEIAFHELLRLIGVVRKATVDFVAKKVDGTEKRIERKVKIEVVGLDCPDLVKEYLVLRQAFDKGQLNLILPEDWDNNPWQLHFLRRVLLDYPEKLEGKERFWEKFFAGNPKNNFPAGMYGNLLTYIVIEFPKRRERAITRLRVIYERFAHHEEISYAYAVGLLKTIVEGKSVEIEETVEQLRVLHERSAQHRGIAHAYATGLIGLGMGQNAEEFRQSVDAMRVLYEQFESDEEMAAIYADGLLHLTSKTPWEENRQIVDNLRFLYERFQDDERIAALYAGGLYNLIIEQPLEESKESINDLTALYGRFPDNEEIAGAYAKTLFYLTVEQPLNETKQSVDSLKAVYERFQDNRVIVHQYAKSMVNLSLAQTTEADVLETLRQSKELQEAYPQNMETKLSYAQTHFNLTLVQSPDILPQTVSKIREFLLQYQEINQDFQEALDEYLTKHPDHAERYASLRI